MSCFFFLSHTSLTHFKSHHSMSSHLHCFCPKWVKARGSLNSFFLIQCPNLKETDRDYFSLFWHIHKALPQGTLCEYSWILQGWQGGCKTFIKTVTTTFTHAQLSYRNEAFENMRLYLTWYPSSFLSVLVDIDAMISPSLTGNKFEET